MKILFINDQFERGGAGRVAAIQCNGLKKKGYDVVLVSDSLHWKETYYINESIPRREIVVKTTKPGLMPKIKKWLICSKNIRKYIKEEKPDVIIAIQSMMFLCAYLGNLGLRVPIIAADHTSFARKIDPIIDFVRYHLYSRAEGLSILTHKDERLLGFKYPRKTVIYNPLSFPVINHPTERKKRILCAGRIEDWKIKGFDIIIEIWAGICNKYPDWTLEIAGSGTKSTKEFLNNLINKYNIQDKVQLIGQITNMRELYAESSIFALSSRIEGFPMVLMEAMSQGCACVAFSVGGASNEMLTSESGYIVEDGDSSNFARRLEELIRNSDLRNKFSINAIRTSSKFSVDAFIESWIQLINKTIY